MRMNTRRIPNDDEDEEYIRRPMSSLMASTTPMTSSNITIISSSDVSTAQTNEKQNKNKNQSLPMTQDFPALSSANTTSTPGKDITIDLFFFIQPQLNYSNSCVRCLDSCYKQSIWKTIRYTTKKEVRCFE